MAAPIQLKANKPGGNNFSKSASAQRPYKGKPAPMPGIASPKMGSSKRSGDKKAAYSASAAFDGYNPPVMGGNSQDYASSWMQSKGLKNTQGRVTRLPYASIPADRLTAGSAPRGGARKSSSGPTKARVKTTYTGKSYKTPSATRAVTRKARVIGT